MWALPDESSEYLIGLYQRACAHADQVIDELDLDAPARVAHWPEARRDTTLGFLLVRMTAETAQHAGHADIVRQSLSTAGAVPTTTWLTTPPGGGLRCQGARGGRRNVPVG